ncbi:hypothetical protein H7J50_25495 [Mycobacterium intermedium]|uniref:hypothetical protein n=1 Tax=Mycobacterium intermedium TaxID=28445 RepID=UPI00111C157F|nr:hypothetical protein [Mycobacterium intermedium]MCV6967131.1 hypothetical protein [Mycobacterium intermedium]
MSSPPRVDMSYSHDDDEHKDWVLQLAYGLRGSLSRSMGQCAVQPDTLHGTHDDAYRVLAVVSETYSKKCNDRSGGAAIEAQMLSARLFAQLDSNAVIPIIRNCPRRGVACISQRSIGQDFRPMRRNSTPAAGLSSLG